METNFCLSPENTHHDWSAIASGVWALKTKPDVTCVVSVSPAHEEWHKFLSVYKLSGGMEIKGK